MRSEVGDQRSEVEEFRRLLSLPTSDFFRQSGSDFRPPTALDGIITVADGRYWPMAVLAVHMLRRTGSTLPVQIWRAGGWGLGAGEKDMLDGMGVTLVDSD